MNRQGRLLIAHPNLSSQTPFYKSVIYIVTDDKEGTTGLIINKSTAYSVNSFAASYGVNLNTTKEKLRFGGPVNTKSIFLLHSEEFMTQGSIHTGNGICVSYDSLILEKMEYQTPAYWRLCIGMCAWQPGQLDLELEAVKPYKAENSWLLAEPNDSIIFEYDGEKQWEKSLAASSRQMINQFF